MSIFDSLFGGGGPTPPNPQNLIGKQQKANQKTFKQGLISTKGPGGSTKYRTGPGGTSLTTSLSPKQNRAFNKSLNKFNRYLGQLPNQKFNPNSIPDTSQIATDYYNQQLGLLQPEFDARNKALEVRASERGLPLGSEAYSGLMDPEARAQEQARQQASLQGSQLATQEHQRLFNNALTQRALPFMEAQSAQGLFNNIRQPQQMNPLGSPQTPNIAGILQQNYQNQFGQYQQDQNAMGSILGAAGQFLPFIL